jgi:recombinational DNA repair protein RecR
MSTLKMRVMAQVAALEKRDRENRKLQTALDHAQRLLSGEEDRVAMLAADTARARENLGLCVRGRTWCTEPGLCDLCEREERRDAA